MDDDKADEMVRADPPPKPESRGRPKATYVWDEAEVGPSLDPDLPSVPAEQTVDDEENYEAAQLKVRALQKKLNDARDLVRRRRIELKHLRDDGKAELHKVQSGWEAKLKAQTDKHYEAETRQKDMKAQLEADIAKLKSKNAKRKEHCERADLLKAKKIKATQEECAAKLRRDKAEWAAAEEKELKAIVEKKRAGIKAKVIKALEPEVHRLISQNREELRLKKEEDAKWLEEERERIEAEHEAILAEEQRTLELQNEQALLDLEEESNAKIKAENARAEEELKELWEKTKQEFDLERKRHEAEKKKTIAEHAARIEEIKAEERRKEAEMLVEHERELQIMNDTVDAADVTAPFSSARPFALCLPVWPSKSAAYSSIEFSTFSRASTLSPLLSMFTPAASWPSKAAPVPPDASRVTPADFWYAM